MTLWQYDGKQYMLPYYFSKTLMVYNKQLFKEVGHRRPARTASTSCSNDAQKIGRERRGPLGVHHAELRLALLGRCSR